MGNRADVAHSFSLRSFTVLLIGLGRINKAFLANLLELRIPQFINEGFLVANLNKYALSKGLFS